MRFCLDEVYETEKKYTSILRVLSVDVSRQIAATCENDKALLGAFLPLYEPIRRIVKNLHSFHESNLQEPMGQHIAGKRQGYFWSIFDEHLTTLARLYASYYVTYDEVQKKLGDLCKTNEAIKAAMDPIKQLVQNNNPISQLICAGQRLPR